MYQKSILNNGIKVVSETIPYVKSISFGVWVQTGSRNETTSNHGISHFIEHLMFKGTNSRTAKDIAEAVDAVGGQLNAFTAKEYTCYYIKVLDTHLSLAMDIMSDMLLHSKFDREDIKREREVVLEEVNMYEDSPDELVHDIHLENVWPEHPLGRNILGTIESISNFNRDKVIDYYKNFYTPDNIVISAAGNFEHDQLLALTDQYFGKMTGKKLALEHNPPVLQATCKLNKKETEQSHICLGTIGISQDSPEIYSEHVLNNILGGGISSRLFQSIREERGLAYSIYSYQTNYHDAGLFTVYAGTRHTNVNQVIELILNNVADIKINGVTYNELTKAKEQLKGNLLLGLESSSSRMSRIGKLEITLGKYISLEEVVKKVDEVSLDDVRTMAQRLFNSGSMCLTVLGPSQEIFLPRNL